MISIVLFALAAICNAIMDNITHHWYKSTFNNLDPKFWCPDVSWKFAKKIFGWKYDAWHVFKSLMLIYMALAVVLYNPIVVFHFDSYKLSLICGIISDIILFGTAWNLVFNLFYNHLLNRK